MTTIKLAVLRHTRAKDGSYKIRISIGHKSETHYIVTKYRVTSLANFANGVVIGQPDAKAINIKLRQLLNDYDERLERIPHANDLSCEELRNLLRDMPATGHTVTLKEVEERYTFNLRREGRNSTAELMTSQLKRFYDYCNGDVFLSNISTRTIDDYYHYLTGQGLSTSYVTMLITPISTLVNYAIKMQFIKYDVSPFIYYKRRYSPPRELDISIDDMRKLFCYQPRQRKMQRTLDLFKLSYILGGMNMKDMLAYDFTDAKTINYVRKKTKLRKTTPTRFSIHPLALPIIERWTDDTGHLNIGTDKYDSFMLCFNRSLKTIARNAGLQKQNICFYTARKSFVQHGFDLGISLEVLEYCIGQSMKTNRPIFNYAKVMSKHADDAINKIMDKIKSSSSVTDKELPLT